MATLVGGRALAVRAPSTSSLAPVRRRQGTTIKCSSGMLAAAAEEDHYRTLRVTPGASKREVKRAFRHLALQYHPDGRRHRCHHEEESGGNGEADEFQRITVAYQAVMGNMREAEERLDYWCCRYGLTEEELDRYRYYLHDDGADDRFCDAPKNL